MALVFAYQAVEGRGQFGKRHHPGHGSAALERVQGTLQVIADRRVMAAGTLQEGVETGQVALRFAAEDVQQLRVEAIEVGDRGWVVFSQAMQMPSQSFDVTQLR